MGAAFRKAFRPPVSVDNWESLQIEAQRIHDSLLKLLREGRLIIKERRERYIVLKSQWYRIYSLLHGLSKHSNECEDDYISLSSDVQYEWLSMMKRKMESLFEKIDISPLTTIPEYD